MGNGRDVLVRKASIGQRGQDPLQIAHCVDANGRGLGAEPAVQV
jgi:hypothetical protein